MPDPGYTRDHIKRFAIATADFDRAHHAKAWVPDNTLVDALRGHALCFANAHRIQVNLTNDDIAFGLAAYRRARGQYRPKWVVSALLPFVSILGVQRDHAA